ncbi:hypothetical protein RN001_005581 [Aquatica leii]|uniref:Uncharacterized protein n=1 Tax=Aquatica leii TaxID=1421715 RepID=A0AAN7Q1H2_9COLE|nr:hypothetical protein RN001_005581 [Aquatica leii]
MAQASKNYCIEALNENNYYNWIEKDFNISYPDAAGKLFETLPIYKNRIIEVAGKRLKSSKELAVKKGLKEYLGCVENGEVNTNTIKKTKNKIPWRPSKLESRDGFITHIKSEAELEETVTRRRAKISSLGLTIEPFIIIIGPYCCP